MNHFVVDNGEGPPFTRYTFDPNELKYRTCAERQLSYLLAVGGVAPQPSAAFDAAKELHMATHRSHAQLPQSEVGTSRKQYVSMCERDVSNTDFSGHVPPFSQQAARFDSAAFQKSKDSRCQQPVDDFTDERLLCATGFRGKTLACIQNVNTNCNFNGPDCTKVKSDFQSDIHYRLSEMALAQKVKQIPRAVIAPMSQTEVTERPYPIDKFSSLPKMLENTCTDKRNPWKDSFDIEQSTSKSCGAMVPATDKFAFSSFTNSACSLANQQSLGSGHGASYVYSKPLSTSEHSGIVSEYFERLHPSRCSNWSSDAGKSKTFDDVDEGLCYIRPQTVENVLSYQNLARKSCGGRSQKAAIPGVTTGKSVPVVLQSDANRNLSYTDMTTKGWPSSETVSLPFSTEMPPERKCGGDRRSATSTSTTCSSLLDSGYSDDRCHSVSLTSSSQSPKLCNLDFAEVPQSLFMLNEARSVINNEAPSVRRPHMQLNSNVDVNSSRSDYRNNHHINMPVSDRKLSDTEVKAVREPAKVKQMIVDECGPKPGIENTMEQTRYLNMLQKQIKLYRVKDEAARSLENSSAQKITMCNNALLNTVCTPETQANRNIVQSSSYNLEKASQDSEFKSVVAMPCSSKTICGSMDFNKCKLRQLEMGGNVHNLISKKKALERKRVGLGTVESHRDGQGASFIRPDSVTYHNSADEYPGLDDFQRMQMNEAKTNAEHPQQLTCSMKYDADMTSSALVNSAEDIVNTWTLMENERKSQLRKDDNSLVSVTPPSIENWKSSSTSFAQTAAKNVHVSPVHVPSTFDDSCERSKFGKQVKKSVSFNDNVALIASTEEVPSKAVDYVEYVTSFLRKRTNGLKSFEVTDDRSSQTGSSSRGSLLSESRSDSSGSRSNSNVSMPESSGSSGDRDSDFYENDGSLCSEEDSEGTTVDETGRIRCSLCHKRWIDTSEIYCKDCSFYMSKFQQAA